MDKRKKTTMQQVGQWLRVGTLTLTALGPIINIINSRWQTRENTRPELAPEPAHITTQEKLQVASAALTEAISDLKAYPYSQQLLKRGEDLTHELRERGSELTHELAKRGEVVSKELKQRSSVAARELYEQRSAFWITFGFAVGLTATTITAYLLVRKRMRRLDEEADIQITWSGSLYNLPLNSPEAGSDNQEMQEMAPVAEQTRFAIPANAAFVGVINTRRYYPIETPLDQLAASNNGSEGITSITYFTSEEDALAHGFTSAEE